MGMGLRIKERDVHSPKRTGVPGLGRTSNSSSATFLVSYLRNEEWPVFMQASEQVWSLRNSTKCKTCHLEALLLREGPPAMLRT